MKAKKNLFEDNFDEVVEFDKSLDVNSILAETPPSLVDEPMDEGEDEEDVEEDITPKKPSGKSAQDVKSSKKKDKTPVLDVNKVLNKSLSERGVKDEDEAEDVTDEDIEESAPASATTSVADDSSDASFTVIFARDLSQQGLLSSFDEDEFLKDVKENGEVEALRNLIKKEIDMNIQATVEDLEAGYKEYLRLTGYGVDKETAASLIDLKNQFESIDEDELEKEENEDLRRDIMMDYFRLTTEMPDEKIQKLVQRSIDSGEDIEESKEYLATLKELINKQIKAEEEQAKEAARLQQEENRRILERLKDDINSLKEVIPGVPVNKQIKQKMYEALVTPVKTKDGRMTNALWAKREEDPIFFDTRLAYLLETGFFDKNKPWNKLSASAVTKQVTKLEEEIKKRNSSLGSGSSNVSSVFGGLRTRGEKDNIEAMRGLFSD